MENIENELKQDILQEMNENNQRFCVFKIMSLLATRSFEKIVIWSSFLIQCLPQKRMC